MISTKYKVFNLRNFRELSQIQRLDEEQRSAIEIVGQIFPFKTNTYVIEQLIDWEQVPNDPMFVLTFPQHGMLKHPHYRQMQRALESGDRDRVRETADRIRWQLNPHPAGQLEYNVPQLDSERLEGMQHKYRQTVLFFPSQGQTCHAYCSFCFRWPQFVGMNELKFATREIEMLVQYLREHREVTDVLFTGGDPLIMKTHILSSFIDAILDADLPNVQTIRIGSKALSFWPYRFLSDDDSDDLMRLFEKITGRRKNLAIMAHVNHPREQRTEAVRKAIARIRQTGAEIRTQAPLLAHINDHPEVWSDMWRDQVALGCIPYYMFLVRDTGAQHYFGVPLGRAYKIFREAYKEVSGLGRTVRGPSMSTNPGKVQILGVQQIMGEKVFVLRFLQGRNPNWVLRPFFAKYDPRATWLDELQPAFGERKFFFEQREVEDRHIIPSDFWE